MLTLTILWTCNACQQTEVLPSATPISAMETPRLLLVDAPTQALRAIINPTQTATAAETIAPPSSTPATGSLLIAPPTFQAADTSSEGMIGYSVEGRAITMRRFGTGSKTVMLVGGMHGGWEANTVELMQQLIDHFEANPADVLEGMTLLIVPVANPDGLAVGRTARGRFNSNGVDLNRNWDCDWSSVAYWRDEVVNPGLHSLSEPETQALADTLLAVRPAAVLFFHSAANGVFPGNCRGDHGSRAMSAVYAEAAGYTCCGGFTAYPVSGTAAEWADGQGIPSADVELSQSDDPEFERNLRAIRALQAWLAQ